MSAEVAPGRTDLELVKIRLTDDDHDPACSWLTGPVVEIVERCQQSLREGTRQMVALLTVPSVSSAPQNRALAAAAIAAIRGLMHALTLELGPSLRINLIVVPSGKEDTATDTLKFISGASGAWIQGATFDLREEECQSS